MFITLHSIVSLVFSLKVSKLECVDEAVHGCGHLIRAQVIDKYEEVMLGYQAKCSRRVREPSSAGKIITHNIKALWNLNVQQKIHKPHFRHSFEWWLNIHPHAYSIGMHKNVNSSFIHIHEYHFVFICKWFCLFHDLTNRENRIKPFCNLTHKMDIGNYFEIVTRFAKIVNKHRYTQRAFCYAMQSVLIANFKSWNYRA